MAHDWKKIHFYSIYDIGWTTDLEGSFYRITAYHKKDGVFIFSWSHPIYRCVTEDNGRFVINKSYFDEAWYPVEVKSGTLSERYSKLIGEGDSCEARNDCVVERNFKFRKDQYFY